MTTNKNYFVIKCDWINATKFVWWPDHCCGWDAHRTHVEYKFTCITEDNCFMFGRI